MISQFGSHVTGKLTRINICHCLGKSSENIQIFDIILSLKRSVGDECRAESAQSGTVGATATGN